MESFQAKISWERLGKRENNKNRSNYSYPTRNRKLKNNNKKIKKHYCGFFRSQNKLGKAEKERK